jgi:phage shock protein PspC (stress-responsive transcriptional regulator)
MKNTMTINLGGMIFHIDEDAYVVLKSYLDRIKEEIKDMDGNQEIGNDIESRIGELIREKLSNYREVATLTDIEEIIAVMGKPEDISGNNKSNKSYRRNKPHKRMYRDTDHRIIGGVCSGMAAYWHVDVILIRVAFVILTIFGMAGAFVYIILWLVLPEANTSTQRLEMRGEEVTIHSIIEFFKDEFENVKRSFKKK